MAQRGARRQYAIPVAIQNAGMLHHFYTDAFSGKGVLSHVDKIVPNKLKNNTIKRMLDRKAAIPKKKVTSFLIDELIYRWKLARSNNPEEKLLAHCNAAKQYNKKICRTFPSDTDVVYAVNGGGLELFRYAQKQGCKCVLDQTIAPYRFHAQILEEERHLWPGWELSNINVDIDLASRREKEEWLLADRILVASSFVKKTLIAQGVQSTKCIIVPYGMNLPEVVPLARDKTHSPIRVLFVGNVCLAKGIHYLLKAIRSLGKKVECRIIGKQACSRSKINEYLDKNIQLFGHIPYSELKRHYNWADIFCLPSLSDGFARVCLEATASGLPVITTPNTGASEIIVENNTGFTVPIRNSDAIAERIAALGHDSELFSALSMNAINSIYKYSIAEYQNRLISVLSGLDEF